VEALKVVDTALLGYEEFNMEKVIEKIMPDVIAVGYDQKGIEEELRKIIQKRGLEIEIVRIDKFEIDEINSSSDIKRKIIESFKR
jgi:glycerol-3-phosphate cytidylyltransferase-like family protein